MMRRLPGCLALLIPMGLANDAEAQPGPYVQFDLGVARAPPPTMHGADNDWSTKCDLIINPGGVEAGNECDAVPPPTSWTSEFDGAAGIQAGLALGYDWGTVRLEGEYLHSVTAHDDDSDLGIFDDVTLDKREQEIELAVGSLGDVQSHSLFANIYYDFRRPSSSWTPYVGVGVGVQRMALDYGSVWKRNDDPERIATFVDPSLRAKLAGTTTIGDARLTDVLIGFQLLVGADYRLRESVTLGVKFRWVDFGEFESKRTLWNQLRSHESSVGRGEDVHYWIKTDDTRFAGISLGLKYEF